MAEEIRLGGKYEANIGAAFANHVGLFTGLAFAGFLDFNFLFKFERNLFNYCRDDAKIESKKVKIADSGVDLEIVKAINMVF